MVAPTGIILSNMLWLHGKNSNPHWGNLQYAPMHIGYLGRTKWEVHLSIVVWCPPKDNHCSAVWFDNELAICMHVSSAFSFSLPLLFGSIFFKAICWAEALNVGMRHWRPLDPLSCFFHSAQLSNTTVALNPCSSDLISFNMKANTTQATQQNSRKSSTHAATQKCKSMPFTQATQLTCCRAHPCPKMSLLAPQGALHAMIFTWPNNRVTILAP